MKILFARIGYMKFYQGPQKGDEKPIGGGKYNKNKVGHEVYNFKDIDGKVYGYFQPHMNKPYRINLKRISPEAAENYLNHVLVIFFAKDPVERGQVIVGWYKRATVHEYILNPENQKKRNNFGYNIKADHANAVLLPFSKRKFPMGHGVKGIKEGNPGQANAFYVLDEKSHEKPKDRLNSWIYDAIEYVGKYNGPSIRTFEDEVSEEIENSAFGGSGQGFQSNIEKKTVVEKYAVERCYKYFSKEGYSIKDVSLYKPYDLVIRKDLEELFVEIKGTQTEGNKIILTNNEVKMSRNQGDKMILFLVHSIEFNGKSVKKGSGEIVIVNPWKLKESKLTPVSYTYKLS